MSNVQGILTLVLGAALGLIVYYPTGQKDWVALLICGIVMFLVDFGARAVSAKPKGFKRFLHPKSGGTLALIPNWALGLAQLGYVLSGNAG